jgi:hypothetical protein
MSAARRHTAIHAPKVPGHNAWIKASSDDGRAYWEALQVVRSWTKANHIAIHDLAAARLGNAIADRFWNEHNFVFQKADGLFYHGKGATPNWAGFSADDDGRTLVPLNMAEPVLVLKHRDNKDAARLRATRRRSQPRTQGLFAREPARAARKHRCAFLLWQGGPVGTAAGLQERGLGAVADQRLRARRGD